MWRRAVDELLMLPRDKKNNRERRGGFAGPGAFLAGVALHALLKGTLAVAREANSRHRSQKAEPENDGSCCQFNFIFLI